MNTLSLRVSSVKGSQNLKKNSEIRMEKLLIIGSSVPLGDFNACVTIEKQVEFVKNLSNDDFSNIEVLSEIYLYSPLKHPVRGTIVRKFQTISKENPDFNQTLIKALKRYLEKNTDYKEDYTICSIVMSCLLGLCENMSFTNVAILENFEEIYHFLNKLASNLLKQVLSDSLSPSVKNEMILLIHNAIRIFLSMFQELGSNLKIKNFETELLKEFCLNLLEIETDLIMDIKTNSGHLIVILSKLSNQYDDIITKILKTSSIRTVSVKDFCIMVGIIVDLERDVQFSLENRWKINHIIANEALSFAKDHSKEQQYVLAASRLIYRLSKMVQKSSLDSSSLVEIEGFLNISFEFVFSHLDNFMDSVRHMSRDSLILLLQFCKTNNLDKEIKVIVEKIQYGVSRSSKFLIISCLAQVYKTEFVLSNLSNIPNELIESFPENNFNTSASNCFDILMQENVKEVSIKQWRERWIDPLISGLSFYESDVNTKLIFESAISRAVKQNPPIIEEIFNNNDSIPILVRLIILSTARKCGLFDNKISTKTHWKSVVEFSLLKLAMVNFDDRIRVMSLKLFTETRKVTEKFIRDEFDLLIFFYKFNANVQSPAIRDEILSLFKVIFNRVGALIQSTDKQKANYRELYLDFLNEMRIISFQNLEMNGNFSRRKLSLSFLVQILRIFHDSSVIIELLESETLILINALVDSYINNKEMSLDILIKYGSKQTIEDHFSNLDYIRGKITSVNPTESITPAFFLELLARTTNLDNFTSSVNIFPNVDINFFKAIIWCQQITLQGLEMAKKNLLLAAEKNPIYGSLFCIRHLMSKLNIKSIESCPVWRELFCGLIETCFNCTDAVVCIVNNSSPEGHLPSDFGNNSNNQFKVTSQMVLLLGWRTIKEVSLILGEISQLPVLKDKRGILTFEQIIKIGNFFKELLATTKHRGAFEQAYVGFSRLCSRLWISKEIELHEMPMTWLEELMAVISETIPLESKICATRRSAGIPFMVQALITSEIQVCSSKALKFCMVKLLDFCEADFKAETRSHSLNILRALFRCSDLNENVIEYVDRALMASIRSFNGDTWSEKNSATLLFSALVVRIFGVQRTKDSDDLNLRNKMTGRIFFLRYPKLYDFFIKELSEVSLELKNGDSNVKLYPILLILSRLYPSALEGTESSLSFNAFVEKIESCSTCPDMKSRILIGKSIGSLLATNFYWNKINKTVPSISYSKDSNETHSKLLIVKQLLRNMSESSFHEIAESEFISTWNNVLALRINWDNMVLVGVVIEILLMLGKRLKERRFAITEPLYSRLRQIETILLKVDHNQKSIIGEDVVMFPFAALTVLTIKNEDEIIPIINNWLEKFTKIGLKRAALNVVLLLISENSVLPEDVELDKWIHFAVNAMEEQKKACLKEKLINDKRIAKVCQEYSNSLSYDLKILALTTLSYLPGFNQCGLESLSSVEFILSSKEHSYQTKASTFKWYAANASQFPNPINLDIAYNFATIDNTFNVRLTATEVLFNINHDYLLQEIVNENVDYLLKFVKIVLLLLQDDDSEIRENVCKFVVRLISIVEDEDRISGLNFVELNAIHRFIKWLSRALIGKLDKQKTISILILILMNEFMNKKQNKVSTEDIDDSDESRVFDRNEANVFVEPEVILKMIKEEIKGLLDDGFSLKNEFFQTKVDELNLRNCSFITDEMF